VSGAWVDQEALKSRLNEFFAQNRDSLSAFGSTVNQTFEAFVFAAVVAWYRQHGWKVVFVHPKGEEEQGALRLKFSTRGRPSGYTYVLCRKGRQKVQVRHQLRVATRAYMESQQALANICLDVAVIRAVNLSGYSTNHAVPVKHLVTFGEAKHMSAFAELLAGFIGVVHEMQPTRLRKGANSRGRPREHLAPFLYVSGYLYPSGQGILETIEHRGYDISVYFKTKALTDQLELPVEDISKAQHQPRQQGAPAAPEPIADG
jgi:hypothetical protein